MFVLFLLSGCKPKGDVGAGSNSYGLNDGSDAGTASAGIQPDEQESDGGPVVIKGDLGKVDWRSLVGQEITVEGDLVIVDTYDLARRGQITVSRNRLCVPTSRIDPNDDDPNGTRFEGGGNVAKVIEKQADNDRATLVLDDGISNQNVFPPPLFPELGSAHKTVRLGSVVTGVTGRLVKNQNNWVLESSKPLNWTPSPRPPLPEVGDADIVVASFNVLNYFTTIDNGSNNARGADSEAELNRQESKIVSAIIALQADVVGLMELENNTEAEQRLVAALNRKIGKETYRGCGTPDGFRAAPGGIDSIRVGIIYRSDRVLPVGDVAMIEDKAFRLARTPLVQKFSNPEGSSSFTVVANHFKSKGGADKADADDKNKGDGQAAYNSTRRGQAKAICKFIDRQMQADENSRILVIGDLNAYEQEDPIDVLRAHGMICLHERIGQVDPAEAWKEQYSYVYYGQCGRLDHAFATRSLAADVTGISTWHINADEPRFLDYNEEYNPEKLYSADPYRSSDHDPVVIGIR